MKKTQKEQIEEWMREMKEFTLAQIKDLCRKHGYSYNFGRLTLYARQVGKLVEFADRRHDPYGWGDKYRI